MGLLLLPLCGWAGKHVPKTQLEVFIHEYRHCEGVELVHLGGFATAACKGFLRLAAKSDPDATEALALLKGVKRLTVLDYDDAPAAVKEKMSSKLERILDGSELLMEAKDGDDVMKMYGVTAKDGGSVSDFVLFAPGDCALICVFGKVSMNAIQQIMESHD